MAEGCEWVEEGVIWCVDWIGWEDHVVEIRGGEGGSCGKAYLLPHTFVALSLYFLFFCLLHYCIFYIWGRECFLFIAKGYARAGGKVEVKLI